MLETVELVDVLEKAAVETKVVLVVVVIAVFESASDDA